MQQRPLGGCLSSKVLGIRLGTLHTRGQKILGRNQLSKWTGNFKKLQTFLRFFIFFSDFFDNVFLWKNWPTVLKNEENKLAKHSEKNLKIHLKKLGILYWRVLEKTNHLHKKMISPKPFNKFFEKIPKICMSFLWFFKFFQIFYITFFLRLLKL